MVYTKVGFMNDIDKFCSRYEATVSTSGRYFRRHQLPPLRVNNMYETSTAKDIFSNITEIPMLNVCLPQDRFAALVEHENRITQLVDSKPFGLHSSYQRLQYIVAEHEEECRLRHTNPALKKAWENYQMILRLTK